MKNESLIIFLILSIPIIYISRRTIFIIRSHGFFRFLSWECILWLLINNYAFWFVDPFSLKQIISWLLLIFSVYPLTSGIILLKKAGKTNSKREGEELFNFEKTTKLIDTGIYKYIRHPLYSSLLFLTWGTYFKNTNLILFFVALSSSVFLYLTSRIDEKECKEYFGEKYYEYIKRSKMFIPFLF
jgi:protein-S-isoprenylcysteine O-methyltransferase Ste14